MLYNVLLLLAPYQKPWRATKSETKKKSLFTGGRITEAKDKVENGSNSKNQSKILTRYVIKGYVSSFDSD